MVGKPKDGWDGCFLSTIRTKGVNFRGGTGTRGNDRIEYVGQEKQKTKTIFLESYTSTYIYIWNDFVFEVCCALHTTRAMIVLATKRGQRQTEGRRVKWNELVALVLFLLKAVFFYAGARYHRQATIPVRTSFWFVPMGGSLGVTNVEHCCVAATRGSRTTTCALPCHA